jgi:diamine N-acetyltransferase
MTGLPVLPSADAVELREITADTVRAVCDLEVGPGQDRFVAPNAVSIAQAHFSDKAWFRAVYAGDTLVGFIMLYEDTETPEYFLWRLMVDHRYQGRGYGKRAVELLVERVRGLPGATRLLTSYVPGDGSPMGLYHALGFVDTGEIDHGEHVTALEL